MTDFRQLPIAEGIRYLEEHGEPQDPRTDIDTASLIAAFPEFAKVRITDVTVSTPHGDQPARIYRVPGTPIAAGFVWAHGGAFIGGHLDMPESHWVGLSLAARGISVLAIDYSKALNGVHFPVPSDDVIAGWQWAVANTEHLGVRPGRVHLGGASAGANLVTGAVARMRDAGEPLPASVVLVYPLLHSSMPEASADLREKLASLPGGGFGGEVSRHLNLNFAGSEAALSDPYAFPGNGDASGLPPVYILNADIDGLRASGEEYGRQIAAAGGEVLVELEPGARHGHLDQPYSPEGQESIRRIAQWLTR